MNSFSIVIPAYNEEKNILILIDEIIKVLQYDRYTYEIIIIDDCSIDSTFDVVSKYSHVKDVRIYKNSINQGQSKSISIGIKKTKFENIVTIDADLQNDPQDILKIAEFYFNNHDYSMVSGIRLKRKDNLVKIISSKLANKIRSLILKDECPDTGCSLKIFKKKIFLNLVFFNGIHRFLPALFIGNGYKIKYMNVNHRARLNGKSNYGTLSRLFWGIRDIIRVKKMIKKK